MAVWCRLLLLMQPLKLLDPLREEPHPTLSGLSVQAEGGIPIPLASSSLPSSNFAAAAAVGYLACHTLMHSANSNQFEWPYPTTACATSLSMKDEVREPEAGSATSSIRAPRSVEG
eukprot:CAMPEP_0172049620 /NCGR_PEP_ID=MMETSP1043-20130122/2174_1 /TAXON_ID=464988 /ORGANISM="Hemiselmis andersenii, Strain CCMP441" /LENGTH=115 /DNA_ID=CAMNT_0012708623 /DNA_START=2320 /DNA_END=2669 /DNA_ORIENTATION=-